MSLFRRASSRTRPVEPNENGGFDNVGDSVPLPPLRPPLNSIPDPSQSPRDGPAPDSNTFKYEHPLAVPSKGTGGTPRSAQSTPARVFSRVGVANGGRPPLARERGSSSRAVKGALDVKPCPAIQAAHFELEEDPSFWNDHNVEVLIRIRPIDGVESALQGYGSCLRQESSKTLTWTGHPETRFTFDHIACETISQEKLFKVVGVPMVENCMSGYNSCMFAYGQTGSGKTYTMMGEIRGRDNNLSEDRGMTPRIFEYLFTRIQEEENNQRDQKLKYNCKCSFLEIYNEQITDLLDPSSANLQLREDLKKGVYVENLREYEVNTVKDVIGLLLQGAANRKIAATDMNNESSRSHSLFTCTIESQWEKDAMTHLRFSRLHLVDLAGSERQKSSGAEGERLKEAANINRSLSTLGLVIMTLVDVANGRHRHVPYRDSRLTFLLQDSLGGNSKTTIIANVSPSICSSNETLSTLKFAQRAKLIQNNAKVNEDASGDVMELQRQIQILKDQLTFLIKHQDIPGPMCCNTMIFETDNVHNFQHECNSSSSGVPLNPSILKPKMKFLDDTLVGALRREKVAEDAVRRLEAEIEQMSHLVREREDDTGRTKMMVRLRDEKIRRFELLADGLLSTDLYLMEENNSLSEEIQLLREKIDRNPELTHFALENIKLLEQLRIYQDFYQQGERETLLAEISDLRNQLLKVYERNHFQSDFPSSEAIQVIEDDIRLDQDGVPGKHFCNIIEELDYYRKRLDACLEANSRLTRETEDLRRQLKKYLNSNKPAVCNDGLALVTADSEVFKQVASCQGIERMAERGDIASSTLHDKVEKMHRELKEVRMLNRKLQHDYSSQLSHQHAMEDIQQQVEGETANTILYLQEELFKLKQEVYSRDVSNSSVSASSMFSTTENQELQDKLYFITQENIKLLESVSAREAETRAVAEEWEKAIVYLTSFLVDGCESLEVASDQIETIMDSFPQQKSWINKHVERAVKVFFEKEKLIHNLQKNLEDARRMGLEMMSKLESLRGATLAMTGARLLENDENANELLQLKRFLSEKESEIQELENLLQCKENIIIEAEKRASAAFVAIKRLNEINTMQLLPTIDDNLMNVVTTKFTNLANPLSSKMQIAESKLVKINEMLSRLKAGTDKHYDFSAQSSGLEPDVFSHSEPEVSLEDNNMIEFRKHESKLASTGSRIVQIIDEMESVYDSLVAVKNQFHTLDQNGIPEPFYAEAKGHCQPTAFQTQTLSNRPDKLELQQVLQRLEWQMEEADTNYKLTEMLHIKLDGARTVAKEETEHVAGLLSKFEEAERTMKEADVILNALLKLNETANQEKDMWKQSSEELLAETTALTAEIQDLKASTSLEEEQYGILLHQINESLIETVDLLSTLEGSFQQAQEEMGKELKVIYDDIFSFGKQLMNSIGTSRSWLETLLSEIMEKHFAVFVSDQCYIGALVGKMTRCNLRAISLPDQKDASNRPGQKLHLHVKNNALAKVEELGDTFNGKLQKNELSSIRSTKVQMCPDGSVDRKTMDYEPCDTFDLKSSLPKGTDFDESSEQEVEAKSSRDLVKQSDTTGDSSSLQRELARKDILLEGLLFDFSLLQESTSNAKDFKDETRQMISVLRQLQYELAAKSAEIDEILVQQRELESQLVDSDAALTSSRADLKQANETLNALLNENTELRALLEDTYAKKMDAEQKLEDKSKLVDGLEREILGMNSLIEERILSSVEEIEEDLKRVTDERDHLREEIVYLTDKLDMASALADENEAIAIEARQVSEASKIYAEEKEEEVKVLECSVEELEETINVLEGKVHNMAEEVESHRMVRGDLEHEVQALRQRILTIETAAEIFDTSDVVPGNKIQIPRQMDAIIAELHEARILVEDLEMDRAKQAKEIKRYRDHISELILHSEAQSSLYHQKFKMLEAMVNEPNNNISNSKQAALPMNKAEKGSIRTRGSGSPFKCISSLVQQVNSENEQELSVARLHIEELETLAVNKEEEVCKLNARLALVDNMTHDVIRDLLEVKLDMTNYANMIDQDQLQSLLENAPHQNEEIIGKEQEILNLQKQIESFMEERDSYIEEANRMKAESLDARITVEQIQRRDQLLTAQNEMLKMDKANLTRKIAELDETVKKLVGSQSIQELIMHRNVILENRLPTVSDNGFTRRLAEADKLLTHTKKEHAIGRKLKGKELPNQRE